jgi:ABC-2 type transport system permease protein
VNALLACVRLGVVHRFTYRLEVLVAVVAALAVVVVNTSLWTSAAEGTGSLGGMDRTQLGTYTVVAWLVAAAVGGRVEDHVGERYRSGAIAADLVRPLDLQGYVLAREAGRGLATLFLTAIPVFAVMALFFPLTLPSRAGTWLAFFLSLVLGGAVGGQIGFLVGIASFQLRNASGLAHLKAAAVLLLSGAVIPVDALPDGLRALVLALPFAAIAHLPTIVFLERVTGGALVGTLVVQAGWAVALLLACRLAWRRALSWLTVQGG